MTENPVSLSHIDPQLTELDHSHADTTTSNQGDDAIDLQPRQSEVEAGTVDTNALDEDTEAQNTQKKTGGAKRKRQPAKPALGSTADYKRKEANRLAAERSRSRQSEKKSSLSERYEWLNDSNARLRAEIARLELEDGSGQTNETEGLAEAVFQQQQQQHSHAQHPEGSITTGSVDIGEGNGSGSGSGTHDAMDAEAEAQAHSRTILAALMSDAEINQALGEHWMTHVDSHEVDHTPVTNEMSHDTLAANNQDPSQSTEMTIEGQGGVPQLSNPHAGNDGHAEQSKSNVMAVALHAEMERHIRDDLASTKAAIDQIEKELLILRAGPNSENDQDPSLPTYVSPLPPQFTSTDPETLTNLITSLENDKSQTTESMSGLRETVIELRDSRISEAERLKDQISDLKVSEEDSSVVAKILQPFKTHLVQMIDRLTEGTASGNEIGSRLGPAIAPRRRGRPARLHPAGRQQDRQRKPKTEKRKSAPRETRTRQGRRSKLPQEIVADEEANGDEQSEKKAPSAHVQVQTASTKPSAEPVETATATTEAPPQQDPPAEQPTTESGNTVQPDVEIDLTQLAESGTGTQAETEVGPEGEGEVDTEPEMTTEQIISQLTHDEQDLHDLLRSHAQAEYEAQQQVTDGMLPSSFTGAVDESSNIDPPGTVRESASGSNSANGGVGGDSIGGELSLDQTLAQQIRALQEPIVFGAGPRGSCDICQRTQTTVWRKIRLPDRDLHVCNPCGMYHIKTGHIRPRELWGDGKMIRKRRKSTHPKGFNNKPESTNKRFKVDTDGSQIPLDPNLELELDHAQGQGQGQGRGQGQGQGHGQGGLVDHGEGSSSHLTLENQQQQQQAVGLTMDNMDNMDNMDDLDGIDGIDGMDGMDGMNGMDHQDHHLEDVVGHEEFRATLGMDGLGEMIHDFGDDHHDHHHDNTAVNQDVVNVFGNVE